MVGHSEKIRQLNLETALHLPDSNINSAVEIVRHCDLVITADTAIVHIARAFDKPMVAVYNKRKLKDTGLPGYTIGRRVMTRPDKLSAKRLTSPT
jgi:ADP-heptose:LPS heptosyltransferase